MATGFIGSQAVLPGTTRRIKDAPSSEWWGYPQAAFRYAQPNNDFFDQYAEVIARFSSNSVYGIPYSDRFPTNNALLQALVSSTGTFVRTWVVDLGAPLTVVEERQTDVVQFTGLVPHPPDKLTLTLRGRKGLSIQLQQEPKVSLHRLVRLGSLRRHSMCVDQAVRRRPSLLDRRADGRKMNQGSVHRAGDDRTLAPSPPHAHGLALPARKATLRLEPGILSLMRVLVSALVISIGCHENCGGAQDLSPAPSDQGLPPTRTPADLGYAVRLWTVEDGVPTVFLSAVSQSRDGYLWWPNPWGMARFDGIRLRTFLLDGQPGSPSQLAFSFTDSTGRVWAVGDSAVGELRDEAWHWVPNPTVDLQPNLFFADPAGRGWFGFQHESGTCLLHLPAGPGDRIRQVRLPIRAWSIAEDEQQRVWLAYGDGVVELGFQQDGAMPELRPTKLGQGMSQSLFRHQDGSIAIASTRAVHALRDGAWSRERAFSCPIDDELNQTAHDRFGQYWIGTRSSGLWVSTAAGWTGRVDLPGLILNEGFGIGAVFCDRENSIWVGSRHGLYQLKRVSFRPALPPTAAAGTEFTDVAPSPDGSVWAAAESGDVYQFASPRDTPARIGPTPFGVRFLERTSAKTAWLASDETVWTFEGLTASWSARFADLGVPSTSVLSMAALGDTAWISLDGAGLWRARQGRLELEPLPVDAPRAANVQVAVNPRGDLRAFVAAAGLCIRHDQGWTLLPTPAPILQSRLSGLHVDPEGRTWLLGSQPPIACYDGSGWIEVPLQTTGFPVEVLAAASDDLGGLWALTRSRGVVRIRRNLAEHPVDLEEEWFGVGDGLPSIAGRGWSKGAIQGPDGRIWFTTALGVAVIDPREHSALRRKSEPPTVLLEELLLDGRLLAGPRNPPVVVPASVSRIEVHFTAMGLKNALQNRFRYRMEGLDEGWTEAGNHRSAVYQRVPPGSYRFHVIAANSDGVWNTEGASFALRVLPHWTQTTAFHFLIAGSVVATLWTARAVKLRQLARDRARREEFTQQLLATQEEERRRIAHELHDSLGQEMLVLKGRIELASLKNPETRPVLDPLCDGIAETIERARALSQTLRPPHLEYFGLSKTLEALTLDLRQAATFEVDSDIEELEPRLPGPAEIGLFRIAQEAVANTLKHSRAKRVWISLKRTDAGVRLTIRDDGRGFDPTTARDSASLGLRGISERASLLGGACQCTAAPGRGVTISVTLQTQAPTEV